MQYGEKDTQTFLEEISIGTTSMEKSISFGLNIPLLGIFPTETSTYEQTAQMSDY